MKEAMLPIPVTKIKQEPCEDLLASPGKSKTPLLGQNCGGSRDITPPSGDSVSSLDKFHIDRSENVSNGSDSGDVIISEGATDSVNRSDFKYECPICQARFKSARAFRGHGIVHRFGAVPELRTRLPPMEIGQNTLQYSPKRLGFESSTFKCDGCQTVFNSRDTYAMHMLMRAKDENCSGLVTDAKPHQLMLEEGLARGSGSDPQLDAPGAMRQGLWNLQMMQKSRGDGKIFDYQQIIPDLIPSPGGSRDLIVCRICGEIFQSKDSLAMHMMFHTQTEAEHSRRGWTVIYASSMSDLTENPEDLIANHELIPIDDPTQESLDGVPHVANDAEVPYSEGVSDDPCYSDEANEGLDLSISSKVNGIKDDRSVTDDERAISKTPNWYGEQGNKCMEVSPSSFGSRRPEEMTDMKTLPSDIQDRLFCFQYDPPKTPPKIPRSQSADVNMSRKPDTEETGERHNINIIRCLTENPARIVSSQNGDGNDFNNHIRPKSADVVLHRHDRHLASSIIGKIRKLRKSRVPTKKYPFRHPFRYARPPEAKKHQEPPKHPEVRQAPLTAGDNSINELLATKGKDLSCCKYCEIIYLDRTLYQLHMGLHNVNNPWQCNACGRICANRLEFSSHVLHY